MSGFKISTGQDLDAIFASRTATDPSAQFIDYITSNGLSLSDRYLPYTSGNVKSVTTGYKTVDINGNIVDLSDLYRKIQSWSALGTPTNGVWGVTSPSVNAIAVLDASNVFVGGSFISVGDMSANYIARWNANTSTWHTMGTPTNGTNSVVSAIAVLDASNVFVGGSFTSAGGTTGRNYIAKWDGTNWNAMGSGVGAVVNAIAVLDASNVFVGGNFTSPGNRIARWNGTTWNTMGTGVNSSVRAIAVLNASNVFVGGDFTSAGGTTGRNYIAKWDGTNWFALGTGVGAIAIIVSAIAVLDASNVFVGGNFTSAGGVSVNRIAKWD
jgi:hypothetical protein